MSGQANGNMRVIIISGQANGNMMVVIMSGQANGNMMVVIMSGQANGNMRVVIMPCLSCFQTLQIRLFFLRNLINMLKPCLKVPSKYDKKIRFASIINTHIKEILIDFFVDRMLAAVLLMSHNVIRTCHQQTLHIT